MSNSNWPKHKLSSLSSRIGDGIHGTPIYADNSEYSFINGNNLKNGYIHITNDTKKVSLTEFNKHFIEFDNETLFLSINGTLGSLAKYRGEPVILGKSAAYIKCSSINVDYLYYYLQLDSIQDYLWNVATGSTIKNLSLASIRNLEIPTPSAEDQQKIANVLSTIDAKIHCNNRINAELESMAKLLYDYWFVQFDFPDENGRPYKTSGGSMVYNEALKRDIPKEWQAIELSEIISRSGTGLNPRDNFRLGDGDNYYVTIKNVTNGKITLDDKCDRISNEALAIIDRRSQLQTGDILFTSIEPVGVTYLIHEKPINWNINESVFTIRPDFNKITSEYLFFLLSSDEMKVFTKNSSTGSIHKGIRHGILKQYVSAYGGKKLIDGFSSITKPILQQMNVLESENHQFSQLRDWLLPMLMNGQVTVS